MRWPVLLPSRATQSLRCSRKCWKAVSLAMIADDRAHRARRTLELRALTIRCASIQFIVEAMAVGRLINVGRFDEAEDAAAQCFEFGQSVGDADVWTYYAGHLAHIRFSQGRHAELAEFATDAAQSPATLPSERALAATAAMFALHAGERGPADRVITLHRSSPDMASYHPSTWLIATHVLAHMAFQLDDAALGRDIASTTRAVPGASPVDVDGSLRSRLGRLALRHGVGCSWRPEWRSDRTGDR